MRAVPRELAERFANTFAGERIGFSGREITDYFSRYSNMVKPYEHYGFTPKRSELFIEALYSLLPKEQYYALTDLCLNSYKSRYSYPSRESREDLLGQLHSYLNVEPIGLRFSTLREHIFREDWLTAYSRLRSNPSASITSARTMLETVFRTIINERNQQPDTSGDLGRLLRQVEQVLNFDTAINQEEHRILNGLTNIINGISGLSNVAGDRHGLIGGEEINDPTVANLVLNASGTVALFFIERHLFLPI
ncbi:MAG: abortive infection family protein [Candidatus Desulfofervidaceae bacterium]|nr:abortive infection family protein [Candidatus Desulfofervidaceae bacterium]